MDSSTRSAARRSMWLKILAVGLLSSVGLWLARVLADAGVPIVVVAGYVLAINVALIAGSIWAARDLFRLLRATSTPVEPALQGREQRAFAIGAAVSVVLVAALAFARSGFVFDGEFWFTAVVGCATTAGCFLFVRRALARRGN
ncbi:hypothetical protein [Phenylobacterium sp. J367]|uniref:hypothetical protein n=1 Tax=Phenylobacterium sp. J367 TaxID=2898435 RepID=UPI002150780E|nr:hypothetical protein [Phenylobacterium sp. J367]MCR5877158.1 hypothetical protein [Phenylobacterium sp. J367]